MIKGLSLYFVAGHYEYEPFGRETVSNGTNPTGFAHRFSTKPVDATTGLLYYGYRYYDPATGRWPSRDPIEERGGVNLYGFVGNDGVIWWDVLGLQTIQPPTEPWVPPYEDPTGKIYVRDPSDGNKDVAWFWIIQDVPDKCEGKASLNETIESHGSRTTHEYNKGWFRHIGAIHQPGDGSPPSILGGTYTEIGGIPKWTVELEFPIVCNKSDELDNDIGDLWGGGRAKLCCNNYYSGSLDIMTFPEMKKRPDDSHFITKLKVDYVISLKGYTCIAPTDSSSVNFELTGPHN